MSKTKEMTIDFRSLPSAISHVSIDNQVVEMLQNINILALLLMTNCPFSLRLMHYVRKPTNACIFYVSSDLSMLANHS